MAVAVEESAGDFYVTLGERFPRHKDLFNDLAGDEVTHAKTYTYLLSKMKVEAGEIYSTEEERTLADKNIRVLESTQLVGSLKKGAERARTVPDLDSALKAAVQLEKDTMLFYYNLGMVLGSKEHRQDVYKIIMVEHTHLSRVESLTT